MLERIVEFFVSDTFRGLMALALIVWLVLCVVAATAFSADVFMLVFLVGAFLLFVVVVGQG